MKWRVLDDYVLVWPDGSLRASAGDVFEGYDDAPSAEVRRAAKAYLRGQEYKLVPAPEDARCTEQEMPPEYARHLLVEPNTEPEPPLEPEPKPLAAPLDRKARRYRTRAL